jgi:glucuronoxylan 4-O-methyltransferase
MNEFVENLINQKNQYVQMDDTVLRRIFEHIYLMEKKVNILVFGLGFDSILYQTANEKGQTYFIEDDQFFININNEIKNKILFEYKTTIKDSMTYTEEDLKKYTEPSILRQIEWDLIIIDGPCGYKDHHPGRCLPIYWSSLCKSATIYIDDSGRDVENKFITMFFPNIDRIDRIDRRGQTTIIYP